MHRRTLLVAALGLSLAGAAVAQDSAALKVGDKAPDFKLEGTDGKTYTLAEFKGKSAVVIAWYPKALTGGCTAECNSLRNEMETLKKYQVQVFAASVDTVDLNKKFATQNSYNFPLLSDTEKKLATALGVLNPVNGLARRWTYIIDANGVIREIDQKVAPANHGKDLAAKLEALGIPKK